MSIVFGSPEANAIRQRDAVISRLTPEERAELEAELGSVKDRLTELYQEIEWHEAEEARLRRALKGEAAE